MSTEPQTPKTEPTGGFEAFALSPELQSVLKELGYEEPTPIQRETIPHLLAGRDVLGQAATGTGKTAAFALPLVERLQGNQREPFSTRALVLVPTRELAMQVAEAIRTYGARRKLAVAAVFGGQEIFHQVKVLKTGVDVVVATPGRVLDHVRRKTLRLGGVRFVVLDEADEMLDMGFAEDLDLILSELPENRQTALFSATLPSRIAAIANEHLDNPIRVTIAPRSLDAGTLPKIRQVAYVVRREMKEAALIRLLDVESPTSALIFCRTRIEVESLSESLARRGMMVSALHGGMTQEQRDLVLRRFKGGELKVLIATDVAARGLHVEALSHVINFDLPVSPEPYVHRIGRTGRAGKDGVALSLLDPREMRLLKNIERTTRMKIPIENLPGVEALKGRREGVLAELVKASMLPRTTETMKKLLGELAKGSTVEDVASAALLVALNRLFPPTDGDGVDFTPGKPTAAARRPFNDDRSDDRRPPRGGDDRRPPRSAEPRGRTERKPFGAAADRRPPTPAAEESPPRESAPKSPRSSAPKAPRASAPKSAPPRAKNERRPFEPPKPYDQRGPAKAAPDRAAERAERAERPARPAAPSRGVPDAVTLFITLGSRAGLRPQDVVGAIANEANISSKSIGQVDIGDESTRVQVPRESAKDVIDALRKTTIRGRRFAIDIDRSGSSPYTPSRPREPREWKK
jgi:ATP-dependent RNA helicase DeaD